MAPICICIEVHSGVINLSFRLSFVLIASFSQQLNCCFLQKEGVYCLIGNFMLNVFQVSVFLHQISYDRYCFWSIISFNVWSLVHFNFLAVLLRHIHSVCWFSPFYMHSLPLFPTFAILKHLTCVLAATPPKSMYTMVPSYCISSCFYYFFLITFRFLDWSLCFEPCLLSGWLLGFWPYVHLTCEFASIQ